MTEARYRRVNLGGFTSTRDLEQTLMQMVIIKIKITTLISGSQRRINKHLSRSTRTPQYQIPRAVGQKQPVAWNKNDRFTLLEAEV